MKYSLERKEAVLKKMMPFYNRSIRQIALYLVSYWGLLTVRKFFGWRIIILSTAEKRYFAGN